METKVCNLNDMEQSVYGLIKENALENNEGGGFCLCELDTEKLGISRKQLSGYISQLVQKGLVRMTDGCYYDGTVIGFNE